MPPKRAASKTPAAPSSASPPLLNAIALAASIGFGLYLLVARGRVTWPPTDLLAGLYTVAGCLALVGPIILLRREGGEGGIGETMWMTGGALLWVFNIAAVTQNAARLSTWATPLGARTMGLVMLAVLFAAWRNRGSGRSWSWTNVTGWALGLLWVGLALGTFVPGNPVRLASL